MENLPEKEKLEKLVIKWKKDADSYQKQVEEARIKNSPFDQMLSAATFLRSCAKELESLVNK